MEYFNIIITARYKNRKYVFKIFYRLNLAPQNLSVLLWRWNFSIWQAYPILSDMLGKDLLNHYLYLWRVEDSKCKVNGAFPGKCQSFCFLTCVLLSKPVFFHYLLKRMACASCTADFRWLSHHFICEIWSRRSPAWASNELSTYCSRLQVCG